jgi:DNA (cytosine-5)-methyltransferase 1
MKFIDLFAGIGGMRLAFEAAGAECICTSEYDKYAKKTYAAFFGSSDSHKNIGNILDAFDGEQLRDAADPNGIPEHDVLVAGFPCQPFSLAGVSKKNALGRAHGFNDPTQGTLFFNIKEILRVRQPKAFLLENVKNLKSHDKGNTWKVISAALAEVGYLFSSKVLEASDVVPQHRERIYIVGVRKDVVAPDWIKFWSDVEFELEKEKNGQRHRYDVMTPAPWPVLGPLLVAQPNPKYTLTPKMWTYLQDYRKKHEAKGNGFGYSVFDATSPRTRTLSARYYKDGSEALIGDGQSTPRKLTPLECLRLQGFPVELETHYDGSTKQPVSDTQAYKQFGNSVCVPVVTAIAKTLCLVVESTMVVEQ